MEMSDLEHGLEYRRFSIPVSSHEEEKMQDT